MMDLHEIGYVFLGVSVFAVAGFWFTLYRLYQGIPLRMGYRMWKLQARSWRGVLQSSALCLGLVYVLKEAAWPSLGDVLPPIPIGFVLGGVIAFIGYSCLPPSVLFLASSHPDQRGLAVRLGRAFRPYRVVYLLYDDGSLSASDHEDFTINNLRTPDDVDWRSVVHPLMDMAPLVVVDIRAPGPAVLEEVERLHRIGQIGKCVFVISASRDSHAIDQVVSDPSVRARLVTIPESEAIPFAKRLTKYA